MRGLILACSLVMFVHGVGGTAEVQVVATTGYESNVYEALTQAQSGLVNKVSVVANGIAWRGARTVINFQQQAAFKHIWQTAPGETQSGDTFVEQFFISARRQVGTGVQLGIRSGLKFKQATRVPGEESYLRFMVEGDATKRLGKVFSGRVRVGAGEVDSRHVLLPQSDYRSVGVDLIVSQKRRFTGHVRVDSRWVDYDRVALGLDDRGSIVPGGTTQADRALSLGMGGQVFVGMLIQMDYAFARNQSNSFGYAFWSHRLQGMAVRHLFRGIDAQLFVQLHLRQYDEELPGLFGRVNETDAYAHSIVILKLSKQLSAQHVVAGQYGFYRNGARSGSGFYRKHGISFRFETQL